MSFLDQFSVWEILAGLVLILVVNTVVFKLLVDWNQSQPLEDSEPITSQSGAGSLPPADLESASSFATASVPLPNRPRRRKHLHPATAYPEPAPAVTTSAEPVASQGPAAPENSAPALSPAPPEPAAAAGAPPAETPRPVITFTSTAADSPPPEPTPSVAAQTPGTPAHATPAEEEKVALPDLATPLILPFPEPAVPAANLPALSAAVPVEPSPEPPASSSHVKISPELPPSEPALPAHAPERKLEDVIPSADLVLTQAVATPTELSGQPASSHPAEETPTMHETPTPPATPAPPEAAPPTSPRSSFRRAVAPARLFLTREFSSVRIRSRRLMPTEPEAARPVPTPEPEPALSAAETVPPTPPEPVSAPATEPGLQSSSFAPVVEVPHSFAPEPAVVPVAEVLPTVEVAFPAATSEPPAPVEAHPEPVVEPTVLSETAPPPKEPIAPEPASVPVPEIHLKPEPEPEPELARQPEPTPEPEPMPATEPVLTSEPAAGPTVEAVPPPLPTAPEREVVPPVPVIHLPERSEALPLVDITPGAAILPTPAAPEQPTQPEPAVISQPIAPFIPTPIMASVQPVTGERATAQLTLSLEVSSLQLTPAFKLGSVQLRPLSNVVSLQLGAGSGPQPAANPLAANISFEIQSVQTGEDGHIQSLVLKPLPQVRADTTPQPRLQVDAVQLSRGTENAPIQITPAQATSTAVQLLTTYTIAGIDFTPLFEIGTMRLEPATRTVMLRLNQPGGAELPPAFEIANVQVGNDGQITLVQLTPSTH